ncbi:membrane protein [Photobacterium aquae]|uniref:Membrane protein n=1 Tax=Photobacterium aquae TaxID=1195763 RepID=A0A0J1JS50_9GAMM|nr:HlyD family efflux transporter periplasmic adaptor subunit [Photobacterium aquae]KLV05092.1 membrane protein [Photobacterium aquae]
MRVKFLTLIVLIMTVSACKYESPSQALGVLERDRVTYSATASEIIRELPVKEGSFVEQGELLVRLDSKNQQAVLAHAMADEAKAAAHLLKLTNGERPEDIAAAQAKVARAQAQLTEAEKNYRRKAELVAKKLISQSEKDTALAVRDSARAQLDSDREKFDKLTAGARLEDIEQAKAELLAAKADVALQEQKLAELDIVATRDGILDNLPYNLGERVPVNGIVAVMQAGVRPYARVYVPAEHRGNMAPGVSVTVHVDGVETAMEGTVRWVATEPSFTPYYALTEDERTRLMYLAEVDLPESAANLPSGIPSQVDLLE